MKIGAFPVSLALRAFRLPGIVGKSSVDKNLLKNRFAIRITNFVTFASRCFAHLTKKDGGQAFVRGSLFLSCVVKIDC